MSNQNETFRAGLNSGLSLAWNDKFNSVMGEKLMTS